MNTASIDNNGSGNNHHNRNDNDNIFERFTLSRACPSAGHLTFSAIAQGEDQAPIVLCLHGFPDHALSYRHQLPEFAAAGYRSIAVTLRGYEPSSIPKDGDYSLIRIAEDIVECIKQLLAERPDQKIHLVGHDWGAAIAYLVGILAPELLHSLTTMAVPNIKHFNAKAIANYPIQVRYSWYMIFFQLRGLSDYFVAKNNFAFIHWLWQSWCPSWKVPSKDIDLVINTLAQPGVQKAALGYYRAMFNIRSKSTRETFKTFKKAINVPTMALTGSEDTCIHTDFFQKLMQEEDFPKGLKVEEVKSVGHFLHQEDPETLNSLMLDWFKKNN